MLAEVAELGGPGEAFISVGFLFPPALRGDFSFCVDLLPVIIMYCFASSGIFRLFAFRYLLVWYSLLLNPHVQRIRTIVPSPFHLLPAA